VHATSKNEENTNVRKVFFELFYFARLLRKADGFFLTPSWMFLVLLDQMKIFRKMRVFYELVEKIVDER
jgi:hypothetical protein